ncbi:MAG: hypothetical protein ACI9MC_003125 [Kiritimatiellia bacterium]
MGCDKPAPGEACETSGSGFSRKDPCAYHCVDWEVKCADGSVVVPSVCTAGVCTTDDDCWEGYSCARTGSSNHDCLPTSICDGGFAPQPPPVE